MPWLIFCIYLVLFSWLITRVGFIKRSGLSSRVLIGLFVVKVLAGIAYFRFLSQPQYRSRSDTWKFYENGVTEANVLQSDPVRFFREIFVSGYSGTGGLFSDQHSYWNDLKDTMMIKLVAVTNLFTFDNYYADIIFFNFFFFFGLIAFYRVMKAVFPGKSHGLLVAIFFIPSFLFWCSGIHKDGLIFSCLGLIIYSFHALVQKKRITLYLLVMISATALIFMLRNYLVFILVPSIATGILLHQFPSKKWILGLLFVVGTALFFGGKYIHPSLNFPAYVVDKHQQFKRLEGNSIINTVNIQPSFSSFITNLPGAVDMGFFRPHPGEKGIMSLLASVEIIFFWLIVIACIVFRRKQFRLPPIVWVCLIFSVLTLLVIGYTVPFSGAVVRYRSLVLPLILTPIIGMLSLNIHIMKKYI